VGAYDLLTGAGYNLTIDGLRTAQGVLMSGPMTEFGVVVGGDATVPTVQNGKVRLDPTQANTLLVEYREAMAPPSATNVANYLYDGTEVPVSAEMLSPRTTRLVFAVQPVIGLDLTLTADDRAGNSSGLILRTVAAADSTGPLVVTVAGVIRPGFGGDEVQISFDEPVKSTTALSAGNYTVQTGGQARSLSGASISYSSVSNLVRLRLAGGQELLAGQPINVGISGIQDLSGNAMAVGRQVGGSATGDTTAPSFTSAFVHWRADPLGRVVDVLFSEDVDSTFASDSLNWTASGGASVLSVTLRERNHARVTLSAALPLGGTLQTTGAPDLAGNLAGTIQIDPIE
jgi:hypothetical protein